MRAGPILRVQSKDVLSGESLCPEIIPRSVWFYPVGTFSFCTPTIHNQSEDVKIFANFLGSLTNVR